MCLKYYKRHIGVRARTVVGLSLVCVLKFNFTEGKCSVNNKMRRFLSFTYT